MTNQAAPAQHQFIPNLCGAHAVLMVMLVAELVAIVLALMAGYYRSINVVDLVRLSFFVQWLGLSSAAFLCWGRVWLNRLPVALAAITVVLLVAVDTLLLSLAVQWLDNWLAGRGVFTSLSVATLASNVSIAIILSGMVMRYFYVQEALRLQREAELEARIQALQSRIRPHFLFNSMNIIASLVSIDPDAAEQVIDDLSQLFRASLKDSGEQVSVAEELQLCRHYARIEQWRLGERLTVNWQIDPQVLRQPLPLLTLQPLLENAVYHGIQPLAAGGRVDVSCRREKDSVLLAVSNPQAAGQRRHQGNRMAQENVRHRLAALYGKQAGLEVSESAEQYRVEIYYPYNKEKGRIDANFGGG